MDTEPQTQPEDDVKNFAPRPRIDGEDNALRAIVSEVFRQNGEFHKARVRPFAMREALFFAAQLGRELGRKEAGQ